MLRGRDGSPATDKTPPSPSHQRRSGAARRAGRWSVREGRAVSGSALPSRRSQSCPTPRGQSHPNLPGQLADDFRRLNAMNGVPRRSFADCLPGFREGRTRCVRFAVRRCLLAPRHDRRRPRRRLSFVPQSPGMLSISSVGNGSVIQFIHQSSSSLPLRRPPIHGRLHE